MIKEEIVNGQGQGHISGYGRLFAVLIVLYILTGITVAASRIHLGALNIWIALLIAAMKASLVALFFMHLKYESTFIKTAFIGTIGTLALLIGFLFWDIAFR